MAVLSLTWKSPYVDKTVFILRRGPGREWWEYEVQIVSRVFESVTHDLWQLMFFFQFALFYWRIPAHSPWNCILVVSAQYWWFLNKTSHLNSFLIERLTSNVIMDDPGARPRLWKSSVTLRTKSSYPGCISPSLFCENCEMMKTI